MQTTRSIAVLPDHVASQIAAGEVIERPASVVKELVENALDSGASQIEIIISSDCRDIRVADNGCGMMPEDAVLAFQRHATSKLRNVEDLWKLSSLGFRGEALPSIAAISRMTCYTRPYDASSGTRVDTDNGKTHATETGCAPGTIMEVVDLFYNVPARLKFLKKASTEFSHIHEIVQSLAIASPGVSFKLEKERTTVLKTTGSGDFSRAVVEAKLFSQEESTCNVNADTNESLSGITIKGLIGKPIHFRGDRKGILSIVNRRPVRCPIVYKALDYAYCDLIPKGRYPIAVLLIDMAPDQVDINIHPSKKEIKYSNGNEVYLAVQRALAKALRDSESQYAVDSSYLSPRYSINVIGMENVKAIGATDYPQDFDTQANGLRATTTIETVSGAIIIRKSAPPVEQLRLGERLSYVAEVGGSKECNSVEEEIVRVNESSAWQGHYVDTDKKLIGYLHSTYILLETTEGLEIIEQHIAHERVLYERILAQQKNKGRLSEDAQRLVISVPLQLKPEQHELLRNEVSLFESFGFEFEWGQDEVLCTQVPLELAHKDYANTIQQLLSELVICEQANLQLETTKSLACQAAIKNGMALSISDILKLLNDWEGTERKDTCPHGRPVCLKFSKEKLFQMFHPN